MVLSQCSMNCSLLSQNHKYMVTSISFFKTNLTQRCALVNKTMKCLNKININNINVIMSAEYICYDDGCHLRKYARKPCRSEMTVTSKVMSHLNIVVDKMHMVDMWMHDGARRPVIHTYFQH